jgi:hypothetical protein
MNMKQKLYGVFSKEGVLITHKIHRQPQLTFFPALFTDYEDACDYAKGIGNVKIVHIKVNKKILYEGDHTR